MYLYIFLLVRPEPFCVSSSLFSFICSGLVSWSNIDIWTFWTNEPPKLYMYIYFKGPCASIRKAADLEIFFSSSSSSTNQTQQRFCHMTSHDRLARLVSDSSSAASHWTPAALNQPQSCRNLPPPLPPLIFYQPFGRKTPSLSPSAFPCPVHLSIPQ